MSEWISVSEGLPERTFSARSKCVLVYCPNILCQFTACYNHDDKGWEYFARGSVDINELVSDWRELPEGPEPKTPQPEGRGE